jgi:hypothetical protein
MPTYHIHIQGHLDDRWADWFAPLTLDRRPDGTTDLRGDLADQAALFGALQKIHDLNLPLLALERLESGEAGGPSP